MIARLSPAEALRRVRRDGVRGLAVRLVHELYRRWDAGEVDQPILDADIASSQDPAIAFRPEPEPVAGPLRIGWLCTPPGPGSGGHTTLFRQIDGMRRRGHRCSIVLYDVRGGAVERHRRVIAENWPWLEAPGEVPVIDASDGLAGFDVLIASSWQTAHVLAGRAPASAHLLYFVQDFEPYFHPHGALYAFAEDSYRLGLYPIALGGMVRARLEEIGVQSAPVPFGRDATAYGLRETGRPRRGVTVYVRKGNDRRGYLLARAALSRFHALHPEQPIHVYGDEIGDWPVPVVSHGHLRPAQLASLYNEVIGGLALSFTNVSLIAGEMLASGAIPVLNDHRDARADLPHPDAVWAAATPEALAAALAAVVEHAAPRERAARAAAYPLPAWEDTQRAVTEIIEARARASAPQLRIGATP